MRAVIQRVNRASLSVDGKIVSNIGYGILVLIGINENDTEVEAKYIAEKLPKLRIFRDSEDKMNLSVLDVEGEIMLVSNFTLYAETKGTNRPSFSHSGSAEHAKPLYDMVVDLVSKKVPTKTGIFQSHMHIDMEADGPVTIIMES